MSFLLRVLIYPLCVSVSVSKLTNLDKFWGQPAAYSLVYAETLATVEHLLYRYVIEESSIKHVDLRIQPERADLSSMRKHDHAVYYLSIYLLTSILLSCTTRS